MDAQAVPKMAIRQPAKNQQKSIDPHLQARTLAGRIIPSITVRHVQKCTHQSQPARVQPLGSCQDLCHALYSSLKNVQGDRDEADPPIDQNGDSFRSLQQDRVVPRQKGARAGRVFSPQQPALLHKRIDRAQNGLPKNRLRQPEEKQVHQQFGGQVGRAQRVRAQIRDRDLQEQI